MYSFIICIHVYNLIGNANGCSSNGCRTMVTIEEERIHDTSNHEGETQSNPFWDYPNQRYHFTKKRLLSSH